MAPGARPPRPRSQPPLHRRAPGRAGRPRRSLRDSRCRLSAAEIDALKPLRWRALFEVWPIVLLFLGVIGGLYAGVVTPTEAGAAGAFLAFAIAFAQGRLNWTVFRDSLVEAIASTARILFVAIGAVLYSKFLALTGLPVFLGGAMDDWALDPLFLVLVLTAEE